MSNRYDVVIIGAGSVGLPITTYLAESKKKVLCLESNFSFGQGNNKKAIGGVRASHSDYGKIKLCQRSIEILSTWESISGNEIGWLSNGYTFVAYNEKAEKTLKETLQYQVALGLNTSWVNPETLDELIPGIEKRGLIGGTYSPDDGSCSPLLTANAFFFKSLEKGATYRFQEKVIDIVFAHGEFTIKTNKNEYVALFLVNAAGNHARTISQLAGFDCPVQPESHEAGVTDAVQRFFEPMVVDISSAPGSSNFYFYQYHEGPVIFCITPDPPIYGTDSDATSQFLPLCVARMLKVYPRLKNLKIRRQWRGQYPMTPDGFPIIGKMKENSHFIQAVGMCGQGFMLGPGVGELIVKIIDNSLSEDDLKILQSFDPYRDFKGMEAFK